MLINLSPPSLSQMHIKLDLRVGISCLAFGLLALLYSILDAPLISAIIQLVWPCSEDAPRSLQASSMKCKDVFVCVCARIHDV